MHQKVLVILETCSLYFKYVLHDIGVWNNVIQMEIKDTKDHSPHTLKSKPACINYYCNIICYFLYNVYTRLNKPVYG